MKMQVIVNTVYEYNVGILLICVRVFMYMCGCVCVCPSNDYGVVLLFGFSQKLDLPYGAIWWCSRVWL